ncbi:hypothetical protein ACFQH8_15750 [Halomicroarcula sp. GCM10025710]
MAADSSGSLTVRLNKTYPDRVTGSTYQMTLDQSNEQVVLASSNPEISVTVGVVTETSLQSSTADGGTIQIAYDGGALVIRDA